MKIERKNNIILDPTSFISNSEITSSNPSIKHIKEKTLNISKENSLNNSKPSVKRRGVTKSRSKELFTNASPTINGDKIRKRSHSPR